MNERAEWGAHNNFRCKGVSAAAGAMWEANLGEGRHEGE